MQKLTTITIGLALAVYGSVSVAGIKNEPADFRGVAWGSPIENYQKELVSLSQTGDYAYYRRPSDSMSWGGADIQKITYRFYKGRFSGSTVQLFGPSNQKAITEKLFELYGEPEKPNKRVVQYFWTGDQAKIVLTCEVTHYCVIDMASLELLALEEKEQPASASKKADD